MDGQPEEELASSELIDDRELGATTDDKFGHEDFVAEIAQVAMRAQPPASIALFAPWGSGKSSIGGLLGPAIVTRAASISPPQNVKFVRLNAFRYGEHPLRRHMIAGLAEELLGKREGRKFVEERLYRSVTRRHIRRPSLNAVSDVAATWRTMLRKGRDDLLVLLRVFVPAVVLVGVVLGIAALLGADIGDAITGAIALLFAVAVFVSTGLLALIGANLTYTASKEALTSAEEFEYAFTELLERREVRNLDRVVIFIDELDRCGAPEVVGTLEAIRTFLEVKRCVFVVAADHQVLEQALAVAARQETPFDVANPYYSAGNAYLDKIFQFQFSLPPLKSQQLSEYAFELVEKAAGVWQRVPHLDHVISVLIPSHVDSPRRVKVLLNSFAITYRIAERRVTAGLISRDLPSRASELAKIVCLRCEFPLFAKELRDDPGLVELVRQASLDLVSEAGNENSPSEEVQRARAYASGSLPSIKLISDAHQDTSVGDAEHVDHDTQEQADAVFAVNARLLTAYLQKTRHIRLERADLVFLSSDTHDGRLAPAIAEQLRSAGLNGEEELALETVKALGTDDERDAAIESLAGLVRERPLGVGGGNAVGVLLHVVPALANVRSHAALRAVEAINTYPDLKLADEQLAPSLSLALDLPDTPVRRVLVNRLRLDARTKDNAAVTAELIARSQQPLSQALSNLRSVGVARGIVAGRLSSSAFATIGDDTGAQVLDSAASALVGQLAPPKEPAEGEAPDAAQTEAHAARLGNAAAFLRALNELGDRPLCARSVAATLTSTDETLLHEAVLEARPELKSDPGPRLSYEALREAAARDLARVGRWLELVDGAALRTHGDYESVLLDQAAKNILDGVLSDPHPEDWESEAKAYVSQFMKVAAATGNLPRLDESSLPATLSEAYPTDALVQSQQPFERVAEIFGAADVLDPTTLAASRLRGTQATLEIDPGSQAEPHDGVAGEIARRIRTYATGAPAQTIQALQSSVAVSGWLSPYDAAEMSYRLAVTSGLALEPGIPDDPESVASLVVTHGEPAAEAATWWLTLRAPASTALPTVLNPLLGMALSPDQQQRVRRSMQSYDAGGRNEVIRRLIVPSASPPSTQMLGALGWSTVAPQVAAEVLVLLAKSEDGPGTVAILQLWSHRGPIGGQSGAALVDEILVPGIQAGDEDLARVVATHLHLASKADRASLDRLLSAISESDLAKDVKSELRDRADEAGLVGRKSWNPFGS